MSNKPTWKGALSEMNLSKEEEDFLEKQHLERLQIQIARINMNTVINWCNDMSKKARKQSGKEVFANRCDQVVTDMLMSLTQYEHILSELRVSRQRNSDLEHQLIIERGISLSQTKIIDTMKNELMQLHPDWKEEQPKERTGFNIIV